MNNSQMMNKLPYWIELNPVKLFFKSWTDLSCKHSVVERLRGHPPWENFNKYVLFLYLGLQHLIRFTIAEKNIFIKKEYNLFF